MSDRILEICVDSAEGLAAAIAGGANRIELCAALPLGGLTPPLSFMRRAASASIPVNAMIRPRAGDFVFGDADVALMLADIDDAAATGLAGVVLGASLSDGRLDEACLRTLHRRAASLGLSTTLHRAFDLAPDSPAALELAVSIGFDRILTSGGAATALLGLDRLAELYAAAHGRISLMPGAGVTPDTIRTIASRLAVMEMHASASEPAHCAAPNVRAFGFGGTNARRTSAEIVRALQRAWQESGHTDAAPVHD
jgi:copper homeostasis protein